MMATEKRVPELELIPILIANNSGTENIPITTNVFQLGRQIGQNNYPLEDPSISKHHCIIAKKNERWEIQDTSTNGIFLNGIRLIPFIYYPIYDDDKIQFGSKIKFRYTFKLCPKEDGPEAKRQKLMDKNLTAFKNSINDLQNRVKSMEFRLNKEKENLAASVVSMERQKEDRKRNKQEYEAKLKGIKAAQEITREMRKEVKSQLEKLVGRVLPSRPRGIVEAIQKHFTCAFCQELLRKPVILQCGHVFCEKCISCWHTKENSCPTCWLDDVPIVGLVSAIEEYRKASRLIESWGQEVVSDLSTPDDPAINLSAASMGLLQRDIIKYFTCRICGLLLVRPVVFNCSHTFCEVCALFWMQKDPSFQCYAPECSDTWRVASSSALCLHDFLCDVSTSLSIYQVKKRRVLLQRRTAFVENFQHESIPQMLKRSTSK